MTFPGADVMKAGFMGDEGFLASAGIWELDEALTLLLVPLTFVEAMLLLISHDISVVTQGSVCNACTMTGVRLKWSLSSSFLLVRFPCFSRMDLFGGALATSSKFYFTALSDQTELRRGGRGVVCHYLSCG